MWDNKNLYYDIDKPTEEYLEELERFYLSSPTPNDIWETLSLYQAGKKKVTSYKPISEWREILAMLIEEIVQQTLNFQQQHPFLPKFGRIKYLLPKGTL